MSRSTEMALRTIVSGGSGALGSAILAAVEARGDRAVNLDRAPGGGGDWLPVDLASGASVNAAVTEAVERLGGLDVLINCAGIFKASEFLDVDEAEFSRIVDVNLLGSFRAAQAAVRHMRPSRGGRVLFVSSIHAQRGVRGRLAYAASKAGIEAMTRVMATELSAHGIRVNALAPGAVSAGMQGSGGLVSDWARVTPAGRKVTAQEVAEMAALLTSDTASFVSGQVVSQDGGASVCQMF
ncbi:SDR family NAD(P)-dependent oxidoreductase [Halovulum sp. GXIMD14794]